MPDAARLAGLRLERANALHEIVESGAQLTGPILAGAAIGWIGPGAVLWLDAASFAVSAALVAAAAPVGGGATGAGAGGGGHYLAGVAASLRFVLGDGPIRAIFVSATVLNALISPLFAVTLPVYAQGAHGSAASLGLIVAALRGRVFGATTAIGFAAAPLGVLLAGALIPAIGVRGVLAGSAVIFLGVVLALARDAGLRELDGTEDGTPARP